MPRPTTTTATFFTTPHVPPDIAFFAAIVQQSQTLRISRETSFQQILRVLFFRRRAEYFGRFFEYVDFYRIRQTHFFRHAPDAVVLIRIVRFTAQCSSDRTAQPCGGALRISFLHLTDDFCHRLQIADFFKCGKPFIQHVKTVTVLNDGRLDPVGDVLIHHRFMYYLLRDIFCPAKGTKSVFSAAVHFNRRSALRALCRNHTHCRSVLPCKFRSFY